MSTMRSLPLAVKSLALLAAILVMAPARAQEREWKFYGYAYDLKTNAYLYTEVHRQRIDGDRWLGGVIEYFLPDGRKLGHKTMDFSQDEFVPLFRLELPLLGYMEAITSAMPVLTMERRKRAGDKVQTETMDRPEPLCADSGFHVFVRSRFAELMSGATVDFKLGVAGSLDWYKFRAKRIADTTFEGKPAVRFRVEPGSILRWLADPLELTYDAQERRLLEYRGISNVRDAATGDSYNTRIAYYSQPPPEVTSLPPLDCTLADCGVPDVD